MKSIKTTHSVNANEQNATSPNQPVAIALQIPQKKEPTLGQRVADSMAAKVGSWAFLIGQTTVLAGWVGCNLMPGLPHWDESPFILLNLVFSFASAYTAPVVLMSQNRQSEEDRENAFHNYQVTQQAAHNIERLHEKMDAMYSHKLEELSTLLKQQQQTAQAVKVVFVPDAAATQADEFVPQSSAIAVLSNGIAPAQGMFFVNVATDQSFQSALDLDSTKVTTQVESNQANMDQ